MDAQTFRETIYRHFHDHPRPFPWRETTDPYRILVSEVMLQQTQTERVLPKYEAFLDRFPTVTALAEASVADVLAVWQGLGYNRRGVMLHRAAQQIADVYGGVVPADPVYLARLPGIGRYTAGAVAAFAYGIATPFIETNIRSVFLHFFFPDRSDVPDAEILPLVESTMDRDHIRDWYNALMDFGVMLKRKGNPSRRSRHHARQSPFRGSDREIRGMIVKYLLQGTGLSEEELVLLTEKDAGRVRDMLSKLEREGMVRESEGLYRVA